MFACARARLVGHDGRARWPRTAHTIASATPYCRSSHRERPHLAEPAFFLRCDDHQSPARSSRFLGMPIRSSRGARPKAGADPAQWHERVYRCPRIVPCRARARGRRWSHARRLGGRAGLCASSLQRATRETQRPSLSRRTRGMRPAIEDHTQQLGSALLCQLAGLLERSAGRGAVGAHAQLAKRTSSAPAHRAGRPCAQLETSSPSRPLFGSVRAVTSASEALIEASVPSCFVPRQAPRTREAFTGALRGSVLRVEQRGVVERAGDLVEQLKLFEGLQALWL